MTTWHRHPSPIGDLLLTGEDGALTGLYTAEHRRAACEPAGTRSPAAIIVPCHRVIAKSGSLQGYAGGTKTKRWLLDHEATHARTHLLTV